MIGGQLVVQRQIVVSLAPHIAHSSGSLDDECVHAHLLQSRRQHQPALPRSDD